MTEWDYHNLSILIHPVMLDKGKQGGKTCRKNMIVLLWGRAFQA